MLAAKSVSLGFGGQQVLSEVNATLDRSTRAGLVGANGSGKTSLLRILAGISQPDSGSVTRARSITVAYLPQQIDLPPAASIRAIAEQGFQREASLEGERNEAARALESDPHNGSLIDTVARIDQILEDTGYHTRHADIQRVLRGLGFPAASLDQPVGTLSGGWAMRVVLARTLLTRPDFLLLDEPTNYLDSESRQWLSRFLNTFDGGYLIVSHDRVFLDETTEEILELFHAGLKRYRGTFSEYEVRRKTELDQLIKRWEEQQREIARQEQFIRRFRAQANKARQVQSRIRMLEKTEVIEIPEHLRPVSIVLPPPPHSGKHVLETDQLTRSFGPTDVLRKINLSVEKGRRVAVVGRNGAGKSTLLRILAGQDRDHTGVVRTGTGVEIGYFAQDAPEQLPRDVSVLEFLEDRATDATRPRVRDILGAFLFSGDNVDKPLGVLSGGERTRLAMASLLVRPVNLLILDEPTNHLDLTSQEVLAGALRTYEGTVVFVSHDRYFLRSVATDTLALWALHDTPVPDGWRYYPGSFQEFEESDLGLVFADPETRGPVETDERRTTGGENHGARTYEQQKALKGEIRRLQQLAEEQLLTIDRLEADQKNVQAEMAQPDAYTDGHRMRTLQKRLAELERETEQLHGKWEETVKRLEDLEI